MDVRIVEKIKYPPVEGRFNLKVLDRQRNVLLDYSNLNLIVSQSKSILATLLGGDGQPVSKIGLGTGTDAAAITDTALTTPEYLPFVSVEYPEPSVVKFNWYLAYDELVDMAISEFGLLTTDDQLFSRRVYAPITKNADMAFEGSWSIRFYTA